jgi:hypothetical protein
LTKNCFVIGPIGEKDSEIRKRSDQILEYVIEPIVRELGYTLTRADQIPEPGIITRQIIERLLNDNLVIADLTSNNPNVTYELALRHAFNKPVIQLKDTSDEFSYLPFDIQGLRTIEVDYRFIKSMDDCKGEIKRQILEIEKNSDKIDSPVSFALDSISVSKSENPKDRMLAEMASQLQDLASKYDSLLSKHEPQPFSLIRFNTLSTLDKYRKYSPETIWKILDALQGESRENKTDEQSKGKKRRKGKK